MRGRPLQGGGVERCEAAAMRAQVRGFLSHEVEAGQPEDLLNADVLVQVLAGPADEPGEEQFQVQVVTPAALQGLLSNGTFLIGRHMLITERFDWAATTAFLRARFEEPESATCPELADMLGRLGLWEFED